MFKSLRGHCDCASTFVLIFALCCAILVHGGLWWATVRYVGSLGRNLARSTISELLLAAAGVFALC